MKHLNNLLPFKSLNQMYKSLVRPHLDYCDIVYHIPPTVRNPPEGVTLHHQMEMVEKIQYQAALAVTGAWQGTDRVKLYEELGWESLSDRRIMRRVLQLHKIIDRKTPSYLLEKLPRNRNIIINLPNVFQETKFGTDRYLNSFFPNATKNWNVIITDFKDLPTYEVLKKHLISLYRPNSRPTFNIHDPSQLRYIFQLRVGLSHLRHHKKRHNFLDTPSDKCYCKNGVEDTRHFLLVCPFYATHREALFASVETILQKCNVTIPISVELLLYGHPSLPQSENKNVLLASLEFISKTNRFAK